MSEVRVPTTLVAEDGFSHRSLVRLVRGSQRTYWSIAFFTLETGLWRSLQFCHTPQEYS